MMTRTNFALMEAENARRAAERSGRPALHPLAEFYGDWERERAARALRSDPDQHIVSLTSESSGC